MIKKIQCLTELNELKHRLIAKFSETSLHCQEAVTDALVDQGISKTLK